MTSTSLRRYLRYNGGRPSNGVRAAALPFKASRISVRSLLSGPRIIHLSDLHFTDQAHTWDVGMQFLRDTQDSPGKCQRLRQFLQQRRADFGTTQVVITGDITDSGGLGDYSIARSFIQGLGQDGFQVSVVPGNHDYCWEGNLCFEDVFKAVLLIQETDEALRQCVKEAVKASSESVLPGLGAFLADALGIDDFIAGLDAEARKAALAQAVVITIQSALASVGFPPGTYPDAFVATIAALFSDTLPIVARTTDTVDNAERRRRYRQFISDLDYPVKVDIPGGALLLLDSMKGQLDEPGRDSLAQGYLGSFQLQRLSGLLNGLQAERARGHRVIVCVHHSPLHATYRPTETHPALELDELGGLRDAEELFAIIADGRVDALLFGHTTPAGVRQQPRPRSSATDSERQQDYGFRTAEEQYKIPLLNCVNLEHVGSDAEMRRCPVTVIDLGSLKRATYDAFAPGREPEIDWGTPH